MYTVCTINFRELVALYFYNIFLVLTAIISQMSWSFYKPLVKLERQARFHQNSSSVYVEKLHVLLDLDA